MQKTDPVRTGTGAGDFPADSPLAQSARITFAERGLKSSIEQAEKITVGSVLRPLVYPYRWHLALAILLNGMHGLAITFQNLTPKWLISDVLKPVDLTPAERLHRAGMLALAYILASAIGRMLVWHLSFRIFTWVRERMVFVLRIRFFRHVNHLCLRFHGHHPSGEIFNYLFGSPLGQFMQFYTHSSMHIAGAVFTIVSTIWIVGLWDPVLTTVLLAMAVGSVFVMHHSRARIRSLHKDYQAAEGNVAAEVADVLRGNKAVKMYAMEQQVAEDFDRNAFFLGRKTYERDVKTHIEYMKYETVTYIAFGILIVTAAWRYMGGHVDEGIIAAYLNSFTGIVGPLSMLFSAATLWGGAQASVERIGTVLKTASSTPDPIAEDQELPGRGAIEFDHVTFSYDMLSEPVLRDFTLTIPYGQTIAFVGPSGAGKTTISQLMLRLYDPQRGNIRIDGKDLRRLRGSKLRRLFGIVPQDPFIFRTTVRENIAVSRPDATDAQIIDACKRANAWEFIRELPRKLDEPVGESGASLSGGQRQRLAIARALLADPHYFIFDEATSALDSIGEARIHETFERELQDCTVIVIAHRLATVRSCDRIVVLCDGAIVQDGTYDALASGEGLFRELVQQQKLT